MTMVLGFDICSAGRLLFNFPGPLGLPYVYLFQISLICAVVVVGMLLTLVWLKQAGRRVSPLVLDSFGVLTLLSIGLAVVMFAHRDMGIACSAGSSPSGLPADTAAFQLSSKCIYGTVAATFIALVAWAWLVVTTWNKRLRVV